MGEAAVFRLFFFCFILFLFCEEMVTGWLWEVEMVAAGISYLCLLKREFQKVQQEDKTGKTTTASSDSSTES